MIINLDGTDYDVYADVATATVYLQADIELSESWASASEATKEKALISATRYIDALSWQGSKTNPAQPLAWPRSGISGVDANIIPQQVVDACCILAGMSVSNTALFAAATTGNNQKRVKAGTVEVEYFFASLRTATVLPTRAQRLVGQWLLGATLGVTYAFGTSIPSTLWDNTQYNVWRGYS